MAQLLFGGASFIAPLVLVDLVSRIHDDTELLGLNRIFRYIIEKELAWVAIYWVFSVLLIVMIFLFVITKIPVVKRTEEEKSGNWEVHKSLFRNKTVYFISWEYLLT
jgi:fucose permease